MVCWSPVWRRLSAQARARQGGSSPLALGCMRHGAGEGARACDTCRACATTCLSDTSPLASRSSSPSKYSWTRSSGDDTREATSPVLTEMEPCGHAHGEGSMRGGRDGAVLRQAAALCTASHSL